MEEAFKDVKLYAHILVKILVISIIAAFFNNFVNAFENKQIAEVGFLIVFLLIIVLTFQSYNIANSIALNVIDDLIHFVEALVPSIMAVTLLSGSTISTTVFGEGIIMLIGIINQFIKVVLLPFLYIIVISVALNTLTEDNSFKKMIELLKKVFEWCTRIVLWIFIGVYGLQSFGVPMIDGLVAKTAKQTISVVPVIGVSIAEISDIVVGCGGLIKNAFGIGAIIAVIVVAVFPVIKILVIALIYKLSAAIIEPISDSRIVTCLSEIGDICYLLLGIVLMVAFMFIIAIAITLQITNSQLYMR